MKPMFNVDVGFFYWEGFSADWIHNFLEHTSYKTIMEMYGTLSIDEMQVEANESISLRRALTHRLS